MSCDWMAFKCRDIMRFFLTGDEVVMTANGSTDAKKLDGPTSGTAKAAGSLDGAAAEEGHGGPSTSARSLGGGSAGNSQRSLEADGGTWQPPGGPSTSARSLGAGSAGRSSVGSRRSLEAGRKLAGPTLHAPRFVVPPGQLLGICGEVLFLILAHITVFLPTLTAYSCE
jgi:hypothetical protein